MKNWLAGVLAIALTFTLWPTDADAKRLGGNRSSGMQRDMPARTAPDAPPAKPAAPGQGTPGTPAQQPGAAAPVAGAAAAGTAAAATRSKWTGPLMGLAAGLGIAALASALGFGEAFATFMTVLLLALVAMLVIGFILRRVAANRQAAYGAAGAGRTGNAGGAQVAWPAQQGSTLERRADAPAPAGAAADPVMPAGTATTAEAAVPVAAAPVRSVPKAFVPAAFDAPSFERAAKLIFIRLQAANDTGDVEDLRSFTTPEMFAELKMDLQERAGAAQHTDVVKVDAQVLDVAEEGAQQVVSVRFTGELREEKDGPLVAFDEVWHMVKPLDDSRSWAIAGIEQMAA